MKQYLDLMRLVLNTGSEKIDRTGVGTLSIFGHQMRFNLEDGFPMLTTKKLHLKSIIHELIWFLNGDTNITYLNQHGVRIWNEWADENGDLGPVYGHQWRFWNAPYSKEFGCSEIYTGKGIDQLQNVINTLKHPTDKYSRRIIMSAWNPEQLDEMALPPCHVLSQFKVTNKNELSCILYQRSGDVGLGIPFNIASYSFLTHLLAKHCNLEAKEFIHFIGDAHIYDDHCDILEQQIQREPYVFPKLTISNIYDNINDYSVKDFTLENYNYYEALKMDMRV